MSEISPAKYTNSLQSPVFGKRYRIMLKSITKKIKRGYTSFMCHLKDIDVKAA